MTKHSDGEIEISLPFLWTRVQNNGWSGAIGWRRVPPDQPFLYGHFWVTISLALRHPQWGPLALPLRAIRKKDNAEAAVDRALRLL
ncbi:MAG: hypothetical protein GXP24_09160 [Planctomycetes bacterium]|nr:hypothetical protein [Planctomycetota bacterium]